MSQFEERKNKDNEDVRHPTQLGKVDQIDGNTPIPFLINDDGHIFGSHFLTPLT
jgi:hypothetical protein